jgi:hypothetical protein
LFGEKFRPEACLFGVFGIDLGVVAGDVLFERGEDGEDVSPLLLGDRGDNSALN